MDYKIPYGKGAQTLQTDHPAQILESGIDKLSGKGTPDEIVKEAMRHPFGGKALGELAKGCKNAVLIVSDHTRPVPSRNIVPFMLQELRQGNPSIQITLLVATGCHRGTTPEELTQKLGPEIVQNEHIIVHDCELSPCTDLGILPSGAHLMINSLAAKADLVVAEGFIEPHFFAGYSGGRKSILPGICSRKTVLGNHCAKFISHPDARTGILDGNPINRDMEAAARMARLAYVVNVIIDEKKQAVAAFAGDPIEAHHAGCSYLEPYCKVTPDTMADIVITSNGGAPLDQNVYQAVKGLTTAESAAASGAVLIICAECLDGIGGEQFYQALKNCDSAESLLNRIQEIPMEETVPDQWQYQILARILKKHRVIFVTRPEMAPFITDMKMEYAGSLQEAYQLADAEKGPDARLTIIPNGISLFL